MLPLVVAIVLAQAEQLSPRQREYMQACATGVGTAIDVLPRVLNADEYRSRGLASCTGSMGRLSSTGEINSEKDLSAFACGYAVGAMFDKYGLGSEIKPKLSERAIKAWRASSREPPRAAAGELRLEQALGKRLALACVNLRRVCRCASAGTLS